MGHIKYGPLPATRPWNEVVGLIAGGHLPPRSPPPPSTPPSAGCAPPPPTTGPSSRRTGCSCASPSPPAPRRSPRRSATAAWGVTDDPDLLGLAVAFSEAVDARMPNNRGRTDVAEMAQTAGVETINGTVNPRASGLFGAGPPEVRQALAGLATPKQFGLFARPFFTRFAFKILAYLLSKTLPQHVGEGRRFRTQAEHERFVDALHDHCHEATAHHARFAGDWFSLHRFQTAGDVTREETQRFFGHAMTKLIGEFRRREGRNVD